VSAPLRLVESAPVDYAHDTAPHVRYAVDSCGLCHGATDNDDCLDCEGLGHAVYQAFGENGAGQPRGLALIPGMAADRLRRLVRKDLSTGEPELPEWAREEILLYARFVERDWDLAKRASERATHAELTAKVNAETVVGQIAQLRKLEQENALLKLALAAEQKMREQDRAALELVTEAANAEAQAMALHVATLEAELELERQRTEEANKRASARRSA
jgi:hypothetical protein